MNLRESAAAIVSAWNGPVRDGNLYGFGLSACLGPRPRQPRLRKYDMYNALEGCNDDYSLIFTHTHTQSPEQDQGHGARVVLKGVFDNRAEELAGPVWGHTVLPGRLAGETDGKIIVFAGDYQAVKEQLTAQGRREFYDFIWCDDFVPLYYFITRNKLVVRQIDHVVGSACSLACAACQMSRPRTRDYFLYPLETLKKDAQGLFGRFDFVNYLSILGGEPLLHPDLAEYVEFVASRYRDRVKKLFMVSNGTITPGRELLEVCRRYQVCFDFSDYSKANIEGYEEKFKKTIETVKQSGAPWEIAHSGPPETPWRDMYAAEDKLAALSNQQLDRHFRICDQWISSSAFADGELYYCTQNLGAKINRGWSCAPGNDFLSLGGESTPGKRLETLMFAMRIVRGGHLSFCRKCAGYDPDFAVPAPFAKQLPPRP